VFEYVSIYLSLFLPSFLPSFRPSFHPLSLSLCLIPSPHARHGSNYHPPPSIYIYH
jgi:hypothetical protein